MPDDTRAARWLPPGFPVPEREVIEKLRQSVMHEVATPHPPELAELALLIALDEAGLDLGDVDARAIWMQPSDEREPVFALLARLLAEETGGG